MPGWYANLNINRWKEGIFELGLKAKSGLVLASSAGFGKAPALEFAREGANILADTGMMRTY